MYNVVEYLIKSAMANPGQFVMQRPLIEKTPNEFTKEDQQTLMDLKLSLPPANQAIIDKRIIARQGVNRAK